MAENTENIIEIKNNKNLNKYVHELQEDVKLNEYNLREKSMTSSSLWAKWISYLFLEKENLSRIGDIKSKILKKKMQNVKLNDSILRMKSEDKLQENDEQMQKISILSKQTQDNIDFIEHALNVLQNFGFSIKNMTDVLKLQMGN